MLLFSTFRMKRGGSTGYTVSANLQYVGYPTIRGTIVENKGYRVERKRARPFRCHALPSPR